MKALTMLKHVKIYSCDLALPHSKVLLEVLENFSLKSLYLDVSIKNHKEVNLIMNLLGKLTQLETLNLDINHSNDVLEPSIIERIFAEIDYLDSLRQLDLKIKISPEKQAVATIKLPLQKLFTKSIPLETFNISCNQVQVSNKKLFCLLKALNTHASSSLKKLSLGVGETIMDQKEFQELLGFLKNFSKIQVLKLPMIGIHNQGYLTELVDIVWTMKNLRSFGVGKFYGPVIGPKFFRGLEKVLSKNGLIEFICDASKDFEKKIKNAGFVLNWKKIKKLNPLLKQVKELQNLFPEPDQLLE